MELRNIKNVLIYKTTWNGSFSLNFHHMLKVIFSWTWQKESAEGRVTIFSSRFLQWHFATRQIIFEGKKFSSSHTKESKSLQKWHFSSLDNIFLSTRPAFHLCSQHQVLIENALVSLTPANHESFPIPAEMKINILSLWGWHSSTKSRPHISI